MHILITDSGVGGLSVVAYAERFIRTHGFREPVRLTFANAAPANDYGYNSMPSREVKLATFDRFLRSVTERFAPDSIYIACNTLSVLLPDTPFFTDPPVPVDGIVGTGARLLFRELDVAGGAAGFSRPKVAGGLKPAAPQDDSRTTAIIFGTQTTIDAGTYPRLLVEGGVEPSQIVSQACPGLADTISEDREGTRTRAEIGGWVRAAVGKMQHPDAPVIASLNCTHYGYRKDFFAEAFEEEGIAAKVVNPNERAVDDLFPGQAGLPVLHQDVEVRFVTRYAIPDTAVEALTYFLSDISPRTVEAMRHFEHVPNLF